MGRYFHSEVDINSPWFCRLLAALPDPYRLLSRRLLTKRNRLLGGVERIFPPNFSQRGHVLKDSEVDLQNRTLRTRTWNLNHSIIMALLRRWSSRFEEDRSWTSWTRLSREVWFLSKVYSLARPIQVTPPYSLY
ncbi:hypothetical protein PBY51_005706 [Eleginops maclovinus]|uniref:PRELI/MSF1 domain-containing protein n=1 Tax=Eleginops maclovinus TaxID=56733 RepID=A0AAN8A094_ELEMC|nr:hypothetical protein PBY51_005706 [Eleginops maclovinus]